jgi:hypothetical protein
MRSKLLVLVTLVCLSGCALSNAPDRSAGRGGDAIAAARAGFHVAPDGNDAATGTFNRPWRTLGHALSRLQAGNTLWVHAGTYRERLDVLAAPGRPFARVTVRAYPGDQPLLSGRLWIREPSYWTIDGLHVTWDDRRAPDEAMVRLYGGTGWVFSHNELSGARSIAALMIDDGPSQDIGQFVVRDNCIHDTVPTNGENQDHNVYVDDFGASRAPSGLIEDNVIFGAPNGNNIKLGGGNGGGPRHVDVRFNSMFGANRNVSLSIAAADNRVYRNVLGGAGEANIFGFSLTGSGNAAFDNVVFGAPAATGESFGSAPIAFARNVMRDPGLDAISCAGFHPRERGLAFGRHAQGR